MRSRKNYRVSATDVYQWALQWLLDAKLIKDHGWLCSTATVWSILVRAAARMISIFAVCRDLAGAPSQQAVFNALTDGLPRTLSVLERRLNEALAAPLPRCLLRRSWAVAIDWHLLPYYGQPKRSRNELYRSKQQQGTTRFHAYATACIVQRGQRYTLALVWIRKHESMVTVLERLLGYLRKIGLKIKHLLVDRAFFTAAILALLQKENIPFLMPVALRGPKPKKGAKKGLRWIARQKAGWYRHTMMRGSNQVAFSVCVSYRTYYRGKKRKNQKLLFAAWRLRGEPTEIRERYRKRFGIETTYRQMHQARIYTCTRDPHLRLVFVVVGFLLRNLWVWIHATQLADSRGQETEPRLALLRFKQLLDWIAQVVDDIFHDGSIPCVELET
jgi:hypothetical protein